ncbi:MAG: alpha-ketoacid dehydrogenase subunit beta [Candidatus Thorarchaeota archaeon]|nr:MAG: alpha-ketoacid dehydrogenase subunit beta [Candidatus Thorarchaeota archaeon]RLI59459.1 MAG: alpha-ketoacid dehydrogenase subunit beta [Candidatus Thorarchaeota archaeon]
MVEMTYRDALKAGLREEMLRDERVFILGEDVGKNWGGAFKVTKGLAEEFGDARVRDTPISENTIVGAAVGASITGLIPVAEIMFGDLITLAMDQVCNQAAKMRYMFGGQTSVPIVIRTVFGGGKNIASHHSQSLEAWFMHTPGLKVAVPAFASDVKGLIKTAIRDPNPVLFAEHKLVYDRKEDVPDEEYTIPFGEAKIRREGADVTLWGTMFMLHKALAVAEELHKEGISVEVIDPRTLVPLDKQTLIESVKKTGRLVLVTEETKTLATTAEIAAMVQEEGFDWLDAPIKRVNAPDTPVPFSPPLEQFFIPDEKRIAQAVRDVV